MPGEIKKCVITKFADLSGYDDDLSFDLHAYRYSEFFVDEHPMVLYLFDEPYDEGLLTDPSHTWVQFAKETKSLIYGIQLRGTGNSKIEGHDPDSSVLFTIKHHLDDVDSVYESVITEYEATPWFVVGRGKAAANLAIWSRLVNQEAFGGVYAIDPDFSDMRELDGKPFSDYMMSNVVISASDQSKLDEYSSLVEKMPKKGSNVVVKLESDHEEIIEELKKMIT